MSMELINREDAKSEMKKAFLTSADRVVINSILNRLPTVQAIPLDKVEQIRAEIADLWHCYPMGHDYEIAINRCLGIIDKAIKEQTT